MFLPGTSQEMGNSSLRGRKYPHSDRNGKRQATCATPLSGKSSFAGWSWKRSKRQSVKEVTICYYSWLQRSDPSKTAQTKTNLGVRV